MPPANQLPNMAPGTGARLPLLSAPRKGWPGAAFPRWLGWSLASPLRRWPLAWAQMAHGTSDGWADGWVGLEKPRVYA